MLANSPKSSGLRQLERLRAIPLPASDGTVVRVARRCEHDDLRAFDIDLQSSDANWGLRSPDAYRDHYGGDNVEFIVAERAGTTLPVAFLRLRVGYRVESFESLYRDVIAPPLPAVTVDVGGYTGPRGFERNLVHGALWGVLASLIHAEEVPVVYAQSRLSMAERFRRFGFTPCSGPFAVPGWAGHWRALAIDRRGRVDGELADLPELLATRGADPVFRGELQRVLDLTESVRLG